jgi:predicted membrane-bound mannosyltransferase
LIPYKTPWLALNLWLPLSLFAARAAQHLWRWTEKHLPHRAAAFTVLAVLAGVLIAHDTRGRVFLHAADETNPYAYAHTSEDILGLPLEIQDLSALHAISSPRIAVIASDPWPLPWYLRHFKQVGFYQRGQQVPAADFYITSTEASEQYADRLRNLRPDLFGLRPNVLILLWTPEPK